MSNTSKLLGIDFELLSPKADRMLGMIFGHCIGSAVGYLTRYKKIPVDFKFPCDERSVENARLRPNDWTGVTDQMLLFADEAAQYSELSDLVKVYPQKFKLLIENGRNGKNGQKRPYAGIFNVIVADPRFETVENVDAVTDLWKKSGGKFCDSSGIPKTICAACIPNADMSSRLAERLCSFTHVDMRCVKVANYLNAILWSFIHGGTFSLIDQLIGDLTSSFEGDLAKYCKIGKSLKLDGAKLNEIGKENDITKLLAVIVYTFEIIKFNEAGARSRGSLSFGKIISHIASKCGDADTNCAIVGAILGSYMGLSKIDKKYYSKIPDLYDLTKTAVNFVRILVDVPKYEHKLTDIASSANILISKIQPPGPKEDNIAQESDFEDKPAEVQVDVVENVAENVAEDINVADNSVSFTHNADDTSINIDNIDNNASINDESHLINDIVIPSTDAPDEIFESEYLVKFDDLPTIDEPFKFDINDVGNSTDEIFADVNFTDENLADENLADVNLADVNANNSNLLSEKDLDIFLADLEG